jgi:hypothetical protein
MTTPVYSMLQSCSTRLGNGDTPLVISGWRILLVSYQASWRSSCVIKDWWFWVQGYVHGLYKPSLLFVSCTIAAVALDYRATIHWYIAYRTQICNFTETMAKHNTSQILVRARNCSRASSIAATPFPPALLSWIPWYEVLTLLRCLLAFRVSLKKGGIYECTCRNCKRKQFLQGMLVRTRTLNGCERIICCDRSGTRCTRTTIVVYPAGWG